jgi:hypothetical protein
VDDEEKENNGAQQSHLARIPLAACTAPVVLIPPPIRPPVIYRYYQRIDGMSRYAGKQNIGNDMDKDIFREQLRIEIELPLGHFRWKQQLQVTCQVYNEKEAQEESGKRHQVLLS